MKFKYNRISSAVAVVVFIMILSELIVSLTVQKQNHASADDLLRSSLTAL